MSEQDLLRARTAEQVLEDHVRLRESAKLDEDLERNYHPEVLVLSGREVLTGHDGLRHAASLLERAVEPDSYRFRALVAGDRMAFAEWSAEGRQSSIRDGVDSYLIEDGCIKAQTIYYTVISSELSMATLTPQRDSRAPDVRAVGDQTHRR